LSQRAAGRDARSVGLTLIRQAREVSNPFCPHTESMDKLPTTLVTNVCPSHTRFQPISADVERSRKLSNEARFRALKVGSDVVRLIAIDLPSSDDGLESPTPWRLKYVLAKQRIRFTSTRGTRATSCLVSCFSAIMSFGPVTWAGGHNHEPSRG
jgi:hypothetical protein